MRCSAEPRVDCCWSARSDDLTDDDCDGPSPIQTVDHVGVPACVVEDAGVGSCLLTLRITRACE
jgi:hypothetical protein